MPKKKKNILPFIIIGVLLAIIIGVIVVAASIRNRVKSVENDYYDFITQERLDQMSEEYEKQEEARPKKGIGETMMEDLIESTYGDEEGDEDDSDLPSYKNGDENLGSPWDRP